MKKIGFLFVFLLLCKFNSIAQSSKIVATPPVTSKEAAAQANYSYKIIGCKNNTFGYDIYTNNKLFIHQTTVPGIAGDTGFSTKQKAQSVAELAIKKMREGQGMPTISKEELIKLKAIK